MKNVYTSVKSLRETGKIGILSYLDRIDFLNVKQISGLLVAFFLFSNICGQVDSSGINKKDTTRIVIGKKEIQIVDGDKGTDIKVKDKRSEDKKEIDEFNENNEKDYSKSSSRLSGGFKGHWRGLDLGLNNYIGSDKSFTLKPEDDFMNLRTSRSINVNLNLLQQSFGLIGNQFGFVTGLGFEFYNYFFENNNTIEKNSQGVIISKFIYRENDPQQLDPIHLDKTKLSMTYLTVPLLLELQFPGHLTNSKRLRVSGGILGGLKLRSHTKYVYEDNGTQKQKNWDDFNLRSLRYGFTGRVGYRHLNLYVNYYPVTLFEKDKGPELYPIAVGISFVGL
jgi:hypothetical protein